MNIVFVHNQVTVWKLTLVLQGCCGNHFVAPSHVPYSALLAVLLGATLLCILVRPRLVNLLSSLEL